MSRLDAHQRSGVTAAALAAALLVSGRAPEAQSVSADEILARVGDYVERYYARAHSIMAEEIVSVQRLGADLRSEGFARRLTYELRVEWDPDAGDHTSPATVTRRLMAINGRPPRPGDEPDCLDPRDTSPEPLAFLLPDRRHKFAFTAAGAGRIDGRAATITDFRSLAPEEPRVEWNDECVTIDLPGRARGRIWTDPETSEVMRLDESIIGLVDIPVPWKQQRRGAARYMTIERADSSIRYRRVTFTDPDETVLLPASIETVTIVRNSGSPRVRISQTFGNYRRFVTGSRIVP